ncbi:hypothetical protein ACHAWO_008041 [Cyclotella atomus]|uniref:Cystinosin n=1 Tax=Cyclotella atomus TaxID=382360 RepID=A0ABD3PA83_9STRA
MNITTSSSGQGGIISRNSSSSNSSNDDDSSRRQNNHINGTADKSRIFSQALSMDEAAAPISSSSLPSSRQLESTSNLTILSLSILTGGSLLGLLLPKNDNLPSHSWQILSNVIGYTYFLAWSTSFYPQILLNRQRRTTHGLSVDFCILNVLGYICYTIYTTNFYFNPIIIQQYKDRMSSNNSNNHHSNYNTNSNDQSTTTTSATTTSAQITVQGNDVAFAIHAVIMASVTLSQIALYDTFAVRPPSRRVYILLGAAMAYCLIYIIGTATLQHHVNYLGLLYVLGSIKIGVTIGKYIPQVLLNRSRKSTVGWNVWNVILDLSGGVLSLVQLIGDCADMGDWSGVTGNPAKILLALVTICFDLIFLVQHYVLYVDGDAEEKHSYSPLPES